MNNRQCNGDKVAFGEIERRRGIDLIGKHTDNAAFPCYNEDLRLTVGMRAYQQWSTDR